MSVTNPPTGASGPGSVGLGAVRGSLKRSVQASFEEGNDYPEVSTLNNDLPDSDSTQLSSAQLSLGSAELSTQRLFKSLIS
ncbi:Mannose-6-phosphate isomerase [Fusarium oxysporum f. sp. albedinis]|nr:Mannose-6-phosphate isomerase [Fusarium oxysporum f. sp. albedinis]